MLDREVVKDFLKSRSRGDGFRIPRGVKINDLVETFCLYTEDDYYEWLVDNYNSFFDNDNKWIRAKVQEYTGAKKLP